MIKNIRLVLLTILLISCSFDNKSGVWTGSDNTKKKKINTNLKPIFKERTNDINKKKISNLESIVFDKTIKYEQWLQSYQNNSNFVNSKAFKNIGSFKKYARASKSKINKNVLFFDNKIFISNEKGDIIIFSTLSNQIIFKYNFYKKKFKKTKKKIHLILSNNNLIVADNLGYVYSLNYEENKIEWAKNFLIPFRSNLKIKDDILFLSDEKNKIILLNVNNGKKLDELYTQPAKSVSKFISNFSIDKLGNLLFLSTAGTLYSLDLVNNKKINWIYNFNQNNQIIFDAKPIIVTDDSIYISTNNKIVAFNFDGRRKWEFDINSKVSPAISGNIIYTVSQNNNLVLIKKDTGEIFYSENIHSIIKDSINKDYKKKIKIFNKLLLLNKKILLISDNSYFVELGMEKKIILNSIKRNAFKISSNLIFIKNNMIFLGEDKKIYKIN